MKIIKRIVFFVFFISSTHIVSSQTQELVKDSIVIKDIYGFRVGVDISNPIRTLFDDTRKSVELLGDYRLTKNIYIAAELGFLDENTIEDHLNFTTTGEYIKVGGNYNLYQNWLDMDNETYVGLRYGYSTFKQTLNNYSVYSDSHLPEYQNLEPTEYKNLNAHWGELVFGMKVETLKNIFLGASFSFKKLIATKEPDNFKNLIVPGFDRVFLNNGGFGFNYTISYRLPIYSKDKNTIDSDEDNSEEK